MSLAWGPHTRAAAERQAAAIRSEAKDERGERLAVRAAGGEFTDYADTHMCPITELYKMCRQYGLHKMADRLKNGDFDATGPESDEWVNSPSGKAAFAQLSPTMKKALGE
jgi:hypothetical protein